MEDPLFPLNDLARRMSIHLRDEETLLQEMLERVHRVRAALLARDIDQLQQATEAMESHRQLHRTLSEKRHTLCQAMAQRLRLGGDRWPLLRFLPYVEPTVRQQLVEQRRALHATIRTIDRINRANMSFIRQFGQLLDETCDRLTGHVRSGCYGQDGRIHSAGPVSLFQTNC